VQYRAPHETRLIETLLMRHRVRTTRKEVPMSMFDTNVKIAGQAPRAVCPLAA
jgi:hypothetical protein